MPVPELTVGVLRGRGLLDPRTGLPGRELLIDRLGIALARARTHGTLVSLIMVRGNVKAAVLLRQTMREDHTVAMFTTDMIAVVAEHSYGDARPVVDRIVAVVPAEVGWHTSDGGMAVHELIFRAEAGFPYSA